MSRRIVPSLPLAAALVLASACETGQAPTAPALDVGIQDSYWVPGDGEEPLKVYTQNVYLGGDTGPLFTIDFSDIPTVLAATNAFWAEVQASGIPERAAAIVDEIDERRPHLVGLQEVVGFAVIDLTTGQIVDGADLLAEIEGQIAARGLPYEVVRVQENTSAALPLEVDFSIGQPVRALAFADRVVALRRTDVEVTSSAQGTYAARLPLGPITLTRGWIRVTTERRGVPHHFVTTHLEIQAAARVQAAQTNELIGSVLAGLDGVTVLAGDLNSDAESEPGEPRWTATYGQLLEAGFVDAWDAAGHAAGDPGYTCCQANDLRNGASELDNRVDFVLVRSDAGGGRLEGALRAEIVGEEQADKTDGGLWPADHGGLAVGMRLALGLLASAHGS